MLAREKHRFDNGSASKVTAQALPFRAYLITIVKYHLPMRMIRSLILCLALFSVVLAKAQTDSHLIQLSGLVLDGSQDTLGSLPYANIYIQREGRGTYTDFSGFFSIVVHKGDTLRFTEVGYLPAIFVVPDSLNAQRYSIVQMMTQDTVNLATAVIFPWPSREHFKLEFLAMDVSSDLALSAQSNLAERRLSQARKEILPDGNESADFFLREQARRSYYVGQMPPMNIFNPISWGQFFNAWKKGDFKKKDDD